MIREGHFGSSEAFSLITIVLITKIFYASPLAIINQLGTAAWYGTLVSCTTALSVFTLVYFLMKRFPGQDLYQIFEIVTGKVVGKTLILIFAFYLLYKTGVNIAEFLAILKVYGLPFTPPSFLIAAFLLVVIAMAYVGLEGIARVANLFFPMVMGGLVLILLLSIPNYDFNFLKPYLGYGLRETIITGMIRASAYDEIIFLAIIINSIHGLKKFKKVGLSSLILTGLVFSTCLACILAAFQFTVGSEHLSGMFQLSRVIYLTRFLQRVEAIFLIIWVVTSVVMVSFIFYITLSSYCRAFNISNHRPLILPFAFLTFLVAMFPDNIAEVLEIHVKVLREFSSLILFSIPVMVLVIALIRGKKGAINSGKA